VDKPYAVNNGLAFVRWAKEPLTGQFVCLLGLQINATELKHFALVRGLYGGGQTANPVRWHVSMVSAHSDSWVWQVVLCSAAKAAGYVVDPYWPAFSYAARLTRSPIDPENCKTIVITDYSGRNLTYEGLHWCDPPGWTLWSSSGLEEGIEVRRKERGLTDPSGKQYCAVQDQRLYLCPGICLPAIYLAPAAPFCWVL